ncbi:metallophosphoesterase family protein [Litoribacter ruber]|uniref:metallophosphoesterase family protein n=1 Tax=Litoribacter ruber TaxID=702568 RepID=UPI001BD9B30B|nr:metallophosphoesterase family protein [Litoribacter ruber]MBT0812631.1 metallophosphoesterase family protein [Litoribacter ruber]
MGKLIGLISDSHSYIDEAVLRHLEDVDEIWHAGDIGELNVIEQLPKGKQLRVVTGNIDDSSAQAEFPEEQLFEVEGVRVLMIHIGGKPPRYAKGIKSRIQQTAPKLFVCGHSHILKVEFDQASNVLYMNPGAIGIQGFHQVRTLLKFELAEGQIKNLRVVELGKRAQARMKQ